MAKSHAQKGLFKAVLFLGIIIALGFTGVLTDGLMYLGQQFCILFPNTPSLEIMSYFESPYLVAGVMAILAMLVGCWLGKKVIKLICFVSCIGVVIAILASLGVIVF